MDNLRTQFTSDTNCEYIIQTVFEIISKKLKLKLVYDENFFSVFNNISTNVFNFESNRHNSLKNINSIVINEINKYVMTNITKFDIEEPTPDVIKSITNTFFDERKKQDTTVVNPHIDPASKYSKNDSVAKNVITVAPNTIPQPKHTTVHLDNISANILLDNVTEITLLYADVPNSDYIITESNNEFIFRENLSTNDKKLYSDIHIIHVDPGNYDNHQLAVILELEINKISINYICEINNINDKFVITNTECNFDILDCSILNILGFKCGFLENKNYYIGDNPTKLYINRFVTINIFLNESELIFNERIYFDCGNVYTHKTFNKIKKFINKKYINSINMEFDDYNFRNYNFNIGFKLTHF